MAEKARVAVVRGGAGADAVVAAGAAIHVDDHGFRAVEETVLRQELHQAGGRGFLALIETCVGDIWQERGAELCGRPFAVCEFLQRGGGDENQVGVSEGAE